MLRSTIAFSLLTALATAQDQEEQLWTQDFAAAKARAKAEHKDLLVDFTGSDWCGWCIRLEKEVFSHAEFQQEAPKHFVLVKLDYPRDKSILTEEIVAQNEKLQTEYSIQGFPTILLMDHDGRVYGQTGYQEGGPGPYNEMLAKKRKDGEGFKAALEAAAKKQGIDRAQALDDALAELDEELVDNYHAAILEEIVALDADGKAGLKEKYGERLAKIEQARMLDAAGQKLNKLIADDMRAGKGEEALQKLDQVIAKPANPVEKQMAMFFKGMVVMDVKADAKAAIAVLEAARKLDPKSPIAERIGQVLPQLQKQIKDGGDGGN